jgi:DNA-binding transcriptional regulator YdaS (Cro superfamily)
VQKLRQYVNSLSPRARESFARRCGTTIEYLRKAISIGSTFSAKLTISIERESGGVVRCEDVDPSADWAFLRETPVRRVVGG